MTNDNLSLFGPKIISGAAKGQVAPKNALGGLRQPQLTILRRPNKLLWRCKLRNFHGLVRGTDASLLLTESVYAGL